MNSKPQYGDLIVFKTPSDNRTDYIKRLIGMPGDEIQIINSEIFINDKKILRKKTFNKPQIRCGNIPMDVDAFEETLNNGNKYVAVYSKVGTMKNSDKYTVPPKHYFLMGDNRDCSRDSRFLSSVGYVHENNLVGKAQIIFFSNDSVSGSVLKFWNWGNSLRIERFFKKIQ